MSKTDDIVNKSENGNDPTVYVGCEPDNHIIIVFSPFPNITDCLIASAFDKSVTDYPYGDFSEDSNIVDTSVEELKYIKLHEDFFNIVELKNIAKFVNHLCNWSQTGNCHIITKKGDSWNVYSFKDGLLWLSNDGCVTIMVLDDYVREMQKSKLEKIEDEDVTNILNNLTIYSYDNKKLVARNIDSNFDKDQLKEGMLYAEQLISEFTSNKIATTPYPNDLAYMMMPYPVILNIPILLKKEMPGYKDLWKECKDKRYIPQGKVLGYYSRGEFDDECKGPQIVLCPENIQEASANQPIEFHVLFAKVLIHEMAHALMDRYRILSGLDFSHTNSKDNRASTLEARAMEESLANMITLDCFEKYATNQLPSVKNYIACNQNCIYRFGINQKGANVDWKKWRNSSKDMKSLEEWFSSCFANGDIKNNLSPQEVKSAYDKVFLPQ